MLRTMRHMTREEHTVIVKLYQEIGAPDILRCLAGLVNYHEPVRVEEHQKTLLRIAREIQGSKPMELKPKGKPLIEILFPDHA
jgi:hypothetical protein